jgi:hypothetical protein
LGMRAGGHRESPNEAPPCTFTFLKVVIIGTSPFFLLEGVALLNDGATVQPEVRLASTRVEALGGVIERLPKATSLRRSFLDEAVLANDTCWAQKCLYMSKDHNDPMTVYVRM